MKTFNGGTFLEVLAEIAADGAGAVYVHDRPGIQKIWVNDVDSMMTWVRERS
jgi:hypothetical protein